MLFTFCFEIFHQNNNKNMLIIYYLFYRNYLFIYLHIYYFLFGCGICDKSNCKTNLLSFELFINRASNKDNRISFCSTEMILLFETFLLTQIKKPWHVLKNIRKLLCIDKNIDISAKKSHFLIG